MNIEKISFTNFVKQISKKSGYAQKDIKEVLNVGSSLVAENLSKGIATAIMQGVVIYPGVYPATDRIENGKTVHYDEVIYPRARFGASFKKQLLFS